MKMADSRNPTELDKLVFREDETDSLSGSNAGRRKVMLALASAAVAVLSFGAGYFAFSSPSDLNEDFVEGSMDGCQRSIFVGRYTPGATHRKRATEVWPKQAGIQGYLHSGSKQLLSYTRGVFTTKMSLGFSGAYCNEWAFSSIDGPTIITNIKIAPDENSASPNGDMCFSAPAKKKKIELIPKGDGSQCTQFLFRAMAPPKAKHILGGLGAAPESFRAVNEKLKNMKSQYVDGENWTWWFQIVAVSGEGSGACLDSNGYWGDFHLWECQDGNNKQSWKFH